MPRDVRRLASFSRDRRYRYHLVRTWGQGKRLCAVLLNPSVANEHRDDPTTTYCMNRAIEWGYGSYEAVNLFALVGTDPRGLTAVDDPVGPRNNGAIRTAIKRADTVLIAWGRHGSHMDRAKTVLSILHGQKLWCWGTNKDGSPKFPRAIPTSSTLVRYCKRT